MRRWPRKGDAAATVVCNIVELGGGFLGGLTAGKYTRLASTSKSTATRDLADLAAKGLLLVRGQGKSTRYAISAPGWTQPVVK